MGIRLYQAHGYTEDGKEIDEKVGTIIHELVFELLDCGYDRADVALMIGQSAGYAVALASLAVQADESE